MSKYRIATLSLAALIAAAPAAIAQQPGAQQVTPPVETPDQPAPATPVTPHMKDATRGGESPAAQAADFQSWIGLPVMSSDGKRLGKVAEIRPASGTEVQEIHADIGGFLGFGVTRVKIDPTLAEKQGEVVVLKLTEDEATKLPKVEG